MEANDIYKRLWQAPDGHTYFGLFNDDYPDHLFDVSKLLNVLYATSYPEEIATDISKLVIAYFIEAAKTAMPEGSDPENVFNTADPVVWFINRLRECIVNNQKLINDYKSAMGLPIETTNESLDRYVYLNGLNL